MKNSDICGEKVLKNISLSLLLVNVFLVKKKLSFSIEIMQIDMVLQFEKVVLRKKKKDK